MAEEMNEQGKVEAQEVDAVAAPPKARVTDAVDETAPEKLERKRDYLEGFLAQKPEEEKAGEPGGNTYDAIIDTLNNKNNPCNMGKSGPRIASSVACPRPGHEKIASTAIAPDKTKPKFSAESDTTGSRALGTAWWRRTAASLKPLARASCR